MSRQGRRPRVLTVAGSDSGGGAGIQADLKTFQELDVFGMSVITAITAQNSMGIQAVYKLPVEAVDAQLQAVLSDIGADAVKTGMLQEATTVEKVAQRLKDYSIVKVVVDPVMSAKDGTELSQTDATLAMQELLFPRAMIITPNVPEACVLLGWREQQLMTLQDMEEAARELLCFGSRFVLLKGGHLQGHDRAESVDMLLGGDLEEPLILRESRIDTIHTHGTGCTTASALAAYIARGYSAAAAATAAKRYVSSAIAAAIPLGSGIGSLWHAAHREEVVGRKL